MLDCGCERHKAETLTLNKNLAPTMFSNDKDSSQEQIQHSLGTKGRGESSV